MSARLVFRWIVFMLAAFYAVRMIAVGPYDGFGGPFRYLTVWALLLSFFCASRMIAREEGRTERRFDAVVSATAVVNGMVVFLYWRLYFDDPTSVTRDGELGRWWLEYYLHALGPALQWLDAFLIHRSFRRPLWAAAVLTGIVAGFVAWSELVVAPLNASPAGEVTSGLPYRFLNNMEPGERAVFYATNLGMALGLLAVMCAVAWVIRRGLPRPAGP